MKQVVKIFLMEDKVTRTCLSYIVNTMAAGPDDAKQEHIWDV